MHGVFLLAAGDGAAQAVDDVAGMGVVDIAVTILYIVGIVGLGCWAGLRLRRKGAAEAKSYFLAGGTLRWPIIGLALFATNISCVHLVSLAQSGYDTGLLNGNFEWMAAFTLIMLGLLFAPFYFRSQVATLPDFLEKRYTRACRDWLAVLSMVSAVIIHIGFSFLTGGHVLSKLFPGVDPVAAILIIAGLTGLYTIVGGLMAVVVTEAIQTVVLVIGASLITYYAWEKMGGWTPMVENLQVPDRLGENEAIRTSMLRPAGDPSGMPWFAIFLGYPVLGIWYWCADQTIVQRVLGARSENDARVGPLFAGLIKILPVFIFVLPGLFAFTLARTEKLDISDLAEPGKRDVRELVLLGELELDEGRLAAAGVYAMDTKVIVVEEARKAGLIDEETATAIRARGKTVYNSKGIYASMITQLMPSGLIGVMVAALLAALMSTVSGALNSISTLFSYDLYKRFRPDTSDHRLVLVGRITAGVALLVAIGLVPLLDNYESIFNGLNDIIAHIAPPVTCVFLLGVFWRGASAQSAKLTLWIGSGLGAAVYLFNKLGPETFLSRIPFMMMAFYLLAVCIVMQIAFSLVYPVRHTEESGKLYWPTPLEPLRAKGWPGLGNYKFLAAALAAVMVVLYWLFQ